MPVRISWNQHEVALLINAYLKVVEGADLGQTAASLSSTLRNLALQSGLEIDDTYRNVNGMKMQLGNVQYLFTDGKKGLSGASSLIRKMVEMYQKQPDEFQKILKEAIQLTGQSMSVEEAFFAYAKDKTGLSSGVLVDCLKKAGDYCQLKQPLLGMTDVKAVHDAQQKTAEGKLLRFRYGKDAQTIRNVTQLYYSFVRDYQEKSVQQPVEEKAQPAQPVEKVTPDSQSLQEGKTESVDTVVESAVVEKPVSNTQAIPAAGDAPYSPTPADDSQPLDGTEQVDFTQDGAYLFTKPVLYTYRGRRFVAKSWNRLYVEVCGLLFADYRDQFMTIMNGDVPEYNTLAFADELSCRRMREPKCFVPGYYLESNLDATSIVRRLRGLHRLFNLGDQLSIAYRSTGNAATEAPEKPQEEWIIQELRIKKIPYVDRRPVDGCLWIASDMSIAISLNEAAERGYRLRFKQNGCRAFPNRPVLWTKDRPKPSRQEKFDTSPFRKKLEGDFRAFLTNDSHLAAVTVSQYCQSIEAVEQFILTHKLDCTLDTTDGAEAQRIYDDLMKREDFVDWNNQRHHQYSAALGQYVLFLGSGDRDENVESGEEKAVKHTIIHAAFIVLREAQGPLSSSQVHEIILNRELYHFYASDTRNVVMSVLNRYCVNNGSSYEEDGDVLVRVARATFQLMNKQDAQAFLSGEAISDNRNDENKAVEADPRWLPILQDAFPDGYILDDFLSQFQAAGFWQERYGETCPVEGDAIDSVMKAIGAERDGRVFAKSEEDTQLLNSICSEINEILSHYTSVYRERIYDRYREQLASCQIYTEQVMTQQLLEASGGSFCSVNQVFAKPGRHASVIRDCHKVLRDHGGPMSVGDVTKVLWFIPYNMVYHYLSVDDEALNIGSSTWMLAEHFPLTSGDAQKIGDMLDEFFLSNNYVQASDLLPLIQQRLPSIADNLSGMTYAAVFNIIQYHLKDHFSFTKAIVSPKGVTVDFTDLFRTFGAERETFTLADLDAFASELKVPIYWEPTYAGGAVRVSKTEFVNKSLIHFDVEAIDQVLEDLCPGDYMTIQAVSSAMMMHLPSCGYSWNGYLLLSYVHGFSRVFRLSYISFGKTGFYGAMVRRDCKEIDNYNALVERVLTDDDTWTTTQDALELLVKRGYQAVRKYKDIESAVEKARMNKQAMQDGR